MVALGQQLPDEMASDEPRPSGHENSHLATSISRLAAIIPEAGPAGYRDFMKKPGLGRNLFIL